MASTLMLERALWGLVLASAIAYAAWRAGSLSYSGGVAAIAVGTSANGAGWKWGALLVLYFVVTVSLSHYRRDERERLTRGIVAKGGTRDATQVIANGGVFAVSALFGQFGPTLFSSAMTSAALGALASATADTWATEIGTLFGRAPRSIVTLGQVPRGTSGGVSLPGFVASAAGAGFIAASAAAMHLSGTPGSVTVAGIAGALCDSLLGATVQERRWCATCEKPSERRVHDCGTPTTHAGGWAWMDNDLVNLLASVAGAAVAAVLSTIS
ncbi:MAG: DUF92 domain-containing protein [Gemmatimonadota bacterium]